MCRTRDALGLRPFRKLLTAYAVNRTGDWFGDIALSVLVLHATGSVLAVSAVWLLGRFVPAAVGPRMTGLIATSERWCRLPLLYALQGGVFACLAIAAHDDAPLPLVLGLVLVDGVIGLVARSLTKAAIVRVSRPAGLLAEANALVNIAFTISMALGPLAAGVVIGTLGAGTGLLIDALSFLAAALVLGGCPAVAPEPRSTHPRPRLRSFSGPVRRLLAVDALTGLFFAVILPVELAFVTGTLGGGEGDFGAVLAAWGIGAVAGSALAPFALRLPTSTVLAAGFALVIGGYLGMGASGSVRSVVVFSALGGIGNGIEGAVLLTALQDATPERLQPHLGAVVEAIHAAAPGAGFLAGGIVAAAASPRAAYWVAGIGALAVLLWFAGAARQVRAPPAREPAPA
jgi:hypothetical protein